MSEPPVKPRVVIGSDHAGFLIKEIIRKYLEATGYAVDDQGTSCEESVDYPDYGKAVGERAPQNKPIWASRSAARASAFPSPPTKSPAFAPPWPTM